MKMHYQAKSLVLFFFLGTSLTFAQTSYTDFWNCVKSTTNGSWGATCTLPGNTTSYVTNTGASTGTPITITVGRAPLTIQGSGANSILERAPYTSTVAAGSLPAGNGPLISIPASVTLTGSGPYPIVIQNLTFNGNRGSQCYKIGTGATVCITYPSIGNPSQKLNGENAVGYFAASYGSGDIALAYSTQAVPVTFSGVTMFDAPGYDILLSRGTSSYNVTIKNSFFGVETGTYAGHGCAYLSCILAWTGNTSQMPYNPVISPTNQFYGAGGGAIAIANATLPNISNNTFFANMREFPWCPSGGGEGVYVQYNAGAGNSTQAIIYNNTLNGDLEESTLCGDNSTKGAGGSGGLEIQGSNHLIQSNYLENHKGTGISLDGVVCATLEGNTVTLNGGDNLYSHYEIVVKADSPLPESTDVQLVANYVYNNTAGSPAAPGFFAWTGGDNVARISYATNTGNSSYFYNNTGGNVASGSAASAAVNSCPSIPPLQ